MDPPPFRAHDGAWYMAQKEAVKLGWVPDPQSSKKLKLKVVKAGDIGLDLAGGGRALGRARVDEVQCTGVPLKREEGLSDTPQPGWEGSQAPYQAQCDRPLWDAWGLQPPA